MHNVDSFSPFNTMFFQKRHFSYETKEATDFAVKDQDLFATHLPQKENV